ncbi:MAG: heat-inducible transcriptional repressor HrcA [Clostridia bacterium]|nr:heat-inducible transcriptional repressor HrcA [Clostridia bacterium]
MDLGDRKRMILQAIVEDYISTAEPVGSRNIAKNHDLSLSAATIRNEMADLEEMGYLDKPHTSAGRVPSELGYRFYVDSLMNRYSMTIEEIARLQRLLDLHYDRLDKMISGISDVISKITRYTTVVAVPKAYGSRVANIKIMLIEPGMGLIVVITDVGEVRNRRMRVAENVAYDVVDAISDFLSEQLTGLCAADITNTRLALIYKALGEYRDMLKGIMSFVLDCLSDGKKDVYVGGTANILAHPEFNDIQRARDFLEFIDDRESAQKVLDLFSDKDIDIKIGSESGVEQMRDASVVVASYHVGERLTGRVGIIGPKRMDYAKVVSSLELISERLGDILYQMFYDK